MRRGAEAVHKAALTLTPKLSHVTPNCPVPSFCWAFFAPRPLPGDRRRIAEQLVFGVVSTGANNDLVTSTELARKMVREWGMSTRIGPMAWGSQGQVFLGEDLMHTRDYSDETARVIDEEVEKILREQEDRCRETLRRYRAGLDAVAQALVERETIEGAEVRRLIDEAMGAAA